MLLALLLLTAESPVWGQLYVDLDGLESGSNAGLTQAGFESFRAPGTDSNTAHTVSATYTDVFGFGQDATVRLEAQRWKNRDEITGGDPAAVALKDMLRDFGGPVTGNTATLALTLPAGVYDITVYHHESRRSQPETAAVTVTDADGIQGPVELSSGYGSTNASPPTMFIVAIRSDGTNEITFLYDNTDSVTTGAFPINGFELTGNTFAQAIDPDPNDRAVGVARDVLLSWKCSSDTADFYDLYLDTESNFPGGVTAPGLTETTFTPDLLDSATKYYWRVDTTSDAGLIPGRVWSFTTVGLAHSPQPGNGDVGVSTDIALRWTPDTVASSYDVYLDTTDGSTWLANVTEPVFNVSLKNDTSYHWRIDEIDAAGDPLATGEVWTFTTRKAAAVIRLNNEQPIVDRSFEGVGGNINGPSLIRIPNWIDPADRVDPSAIYYLYFANHGGDYIRMAWASDIEGPYNIYNPDNGVLKLGISVGSLTVSGHVASPDVHVDDANRRIIMYFHGGGVRWNGVNRGQSTCVATSPYGLDFNGRVEETIVGNFYYRVFAHGGQLYAIAKEGWAWKARNPDDPWNPDGVDLTKQYLWTRSAANPFAALGKTVRHNALRVVGDTLHVYYSCYPDEPERILHSTIDMSGGAFDSWIATTPPEEIIEPELDWEGADLPLAMSRSGSGTNVRQLRDPALFTDIDGAHYLLYSGRGEEAIGLARFVNTCGMPPLAGDLSGDCTVNLADLIITADKWLQPYDMADFAVLANNWLLDIASQ